MYKSMFSDREIFFGIFCLVFGGFMLGVETHWFFSGQPIFAKNNHPSQAECEQELPRNQQCEQVWILGESDE